VTSAFPLVSVIIPCRDEENTIVGVLEAFAAQTYPLTRMEIILADGFSTDGTRIRVRTFLAEHPEYPLRLIDNPGLTAPAGINAGVRDSRGEIILRMDAHAFPQPDYIQRCVELLRKTGSDGVGGSVDVLPRVNTVWARAIAAAGANPFSTGGSRFRVGGAMGEVDTIPFGAYRRDVFDRLGGFNESVPVNEDYEWNYRVRKSGGKIVYSPEIRSQYFSRGTIPAMIRQYFMYGRQKAVMLSFHPESLKLRQAIPALFLPSLALGFFAGFLWKPLWFLSVGELLLYLSFAVFFSAWDAMRRRQGEFLFSLPPIFLLIHIFWGLGFWVGCWRTLIGKR
jgi:succinoglycan biosynthesis protein ExoA